MKNSNGVTMRRMILGAVLLGAFATPVHGQLTRINETRPLGADQAVDIEVVSHSLVVEGWDRNEIQIVGEYDPAFDEIEIDQDAATFRFEIEEPNNNRRRGRGTDRSLQIRVPRAARVNFETVSGAITVTGYRGVLDASSVSGAVEATGNMESVELSSVSGRILHTGNAEIVQLESVSGTVEYRGTAGSVGLESVSGRVLMDGSAGTIDAESVSGSVRIIATTAVESLDASSVSGTVDFRGRLAADSRVDVESHSGSVELELVGTTNAEFELESFSGSVDATLANMRDVVRDRGRVTPDESMRFVTGSGAGRVSATSFSGSVRIIEAR
jgi:DUF4097 and DUF4098 domain-containing protein YvlB